MSEAINDGAGKRRLRLAAAAAAAVVSMSVFTGCASRRNKNEENDFIYSQNVLPKTTMYSSAAESFRNSADVSDYARDTDDSMKTEYADSQTVTSGDAASSQTEEETEISALSETEVPEIFTSESLTTTESTTAEETEAPVTVSTTETSTEIVTECSVPMAEEATVTVPPTPTETAGTAAVSDSDYNADFFSEDLFIGDSISTGYSLYGFLKEENVFAKVGLNPSTVLTKSVSTCYGDIDVTTMLTYTSPKHVYIMLGSNGIQWLSVGNMLQSTDTLVKLIQTTVPDAEPVIISVPPVTFEYDISIEDVNVMDKINEYNLSLSTYCTSNDLLYIDAASSLKNDYGYFDYSYAESDGMHFKYAAYNTLLSKIQTDVTAYDNKKAEEEALETISETETVSETSVSAESETTTAGTETTSAESSQNNADTQPETTQTASPSAQTDSAWETVSGTKVSETEVSDEQIPQKRKPSKNKLSNRA